MNRSLFVDHLYNQDCVPDEHCDAQESQLWKNLINGEVCYVPYEDELEVMTWGHIVYELKIDPPLAYDSDYHIYVGWREVHYKAYIDAVEQPKSEENEKKDSGE